MRRGKVHERFERGQTKLSRAAQGYFSFMEQFQGQQSGRLPRSVGPVQSGSLEQFLWQVHIHGLHT